MNRGVRNKQINRYTQKQETKQRTKQCTDIINHKHAVEEV